MDQILIIELFSPVSGQVQKYAQPEIKWRYAALF
jgi:hypothetical protein